MDTFVSGEAKMELLKSLADGSVGGFPKNSPMAEAVAFALSALGSNGFNQSVVQEWVGRLYLMQQSVLLTAIRGPDGIHKDHISKKLNRWLRRCILIASFDKIVYPVPYDADPAWRTGSFTGPSCSWSGQLSGQQTFYANSNVAYGTWQEAMNEVVSLYLMTVDELPHHYQLHVMHAAEILGYNHPVKETREWWNHTYLRLVNDMHLYPESESDMNLRLCDTEKNWRAREEVTATK